MSSARPGPYEVLLELIEDELRHAGEGRLEELPKLAAARAELIATLPSAPPASARPALERALLMHKRLVVELHHCRDELLLELRQIELARRTARGYAPPSQRRPIISTDA